jgi:IS1 family transposase
VSINTVTKLLVDAGETCLALHDELVRGVKSERIQADEIWSFCYAKAKNVATAQAAPEGAGDVWTWTALDADTKLMVSYFVGDRSGDSAAILAHDLRSRVVSETVQITTDAHNAYLRAIEDAFGADANYATLQKVYRTDPKAAQGRYSPPVCIGTRTRVVEQPQRGSYFDQLR